MMQTPQFLNVKLTNIFIGTSNPRKFFDEEYIKGLAASIKTTGLLQPIVLREKDGTYQLVCGECRLRASKIVAMDEPDRDEISAAVHELTDEQALEMQIVENLQRKDVHTMEEAAAFKSLLDLNGFTLDQLCDRLGKSRHYIGQRLKLNDLIEPVQHAFYKSTITLDAAKQLCQLTHEVQMQIYKDKIEQADGHVHVNKLQLQMYKGDLAAVTFELDDHNLRPEMGACTVCVHNTASFNSLFPEENGAARCTNTPCMQIKQLVYFNTTLSEAINDPEIVLVSTDNRELSSEVAKITEGHEVLLRDGWYAEGKPTKPNRETDYKWCDDDAEIDQEYTNDLKNYEAEYEKYNADISEGKYLRAFVVDGSGAGRFHWITKTSKATKATTQVSPIKSGKIPDGVAVSPTQVKDEIKRIEDKEKRNKQLDAEKMQPIFYKAVEANEEFKTKNSPLNVIELGAFLIVLLDTCGYHVRNNFYETANISDEQQVDFYGHLKLLNVVEIQKLYNLFARITILDKCNVSDGMRPDNCEKAAALVDIAELYVPEDVKGIRIAQGEVANIRQGRVNEKLKGLTAALEGKKLKTEKEKRKERDTERNNKEQNDRAANYLEKDKDFQARQKQREFAETIAQDKKGKKSSVKKVLKEPVKPAPKKAAKKSAKKATKKVVKKSGKK